MMLSREQVEFIQGCLTMACVAGQLPKDALEAMMPVFENDAVLRERVRELEKDNAAKFLEIRKMESDCLEHCQDWTRAQLKLNTLTTAHQQAVKEGNECLVKLNQVIAWRKADEEMIKGQSASLQQAVKALAGVRTERDAAIEAQNQALEIATVINDPRVARLQAQLQAVEAALKYMADENSWSVEDGSYQMRRPGGSQHIGIFISSHFLNPWRFAQEALGIQGEAGHE